MSRRQNYHQPSPPPYFRIGLVQEPHIHQIHSRDSSDSHALEPSSTACPRGDCLISNLRFRLGWDNNSAIGSGEAATVRCCGEYNPACIALSLDTDPA